MICYRKQKSNYEDKTELDIKLTVPTSITTKDHEKITEAFRVLESFVAAEKPEK